MNIFNSLTFSGQKKTICILLTLRPYPYQFFFPFINFYTIFIFVEEFWGRACFCDLLLAFVADVNLVAEPKPHQIGRKRPNVAKTSGDW